MAKIAQIQGAAVLTDTAPTVWTAVEEFHFQLCAALSSRGIQPVIIHGLQPSQEYCSRMRTSGAVVTNLNYFAMGPYQFFRALGTIFRQYHVGVVQSRGYNYFRLLWWMVRLQGVRRIIFVEGNSGVLRSQSWKRFLLRLRTRVMTMPITQVITISQFVK